MCLLLLGWSPSYPLDSSSVSESHKWENRGKSGAAWRLNHKGASASLTGRKGAGSPPQELSGGEKRWRICSPFAHNALLPLPPSPPPQHAHISRQQACGQGGRRQVAVLTWGRSEASGRELLVQCRLGCRSWELGPRWWERASFFPSTEACSPPTMLWHRGPFLKPG